MDAIAIPEFLHPAVEQILGPIVGPKCTHEFISVPIMQYSPACIKHTLSKGIGYGIIASGALFKIPQIVKLVSTQNSKGVSELAHVLESVASMIFVSYNYKQGYPISTYGETAFIVIQNLMIILIMQVLHNVPKLSVFAYFCAYSGVAWAVLNVVPLSYIQILQTFAVLISVSGKLFTVRSIVSTKDSSGVSLVTLSMYLLGSVARIFTGISEVGDDLLLLGTYFVNGILNLILVLVARYYQKQHRPSADKKTS